MANKRYKELVVGIDQSYENTGVCVASDGLIRDIKSIRLGKYSCNAERREILRAKLEYLLSVVAQKSDNIVCIVERARVHGGVKSFINVDVIKSMGSLTALTVDIMYRYSVPVYSVDTRSWKAQVVGTSKPMPNKFGVPNEKWPTVKWVIDQGFEDKILVDVTDTRKQNGTFIRDGKKYMYNNDAADSAGIAMYWYIGDRGMLKEEK